MPMSNKQNKPSSYSRYKKYYVKYNSKPEVKKRHREYAREYYKRPEVKRKHREYMRRYFRSKRGRQLMNKYHQKYYQNNIEYIRLKEFVSNMQRRLQRHKINSSMYYQKPYSKYNSQIITQSLEEELEMYQKYLNDYKEFKKELSKIKDEEARSELKERYMYDLAKRISKNYAGNNIYQRYR